jgi:hypothetical protein
MKIRVVLFLTLILLFLAGCEGFPSIKSNPIEMPAEPLATGPTEVDNSEITWGIDMHADEILANGNAILKVAVATDELLSEYSSNIEFVDDETGYKFAFLPYVTIHDFQWIEVNHRIADNMIVHYQQSVLYSAGDLSPDMPFVVTSMDDDMPRRGISFADEYSERKYFAITLNQAEPEERPGTFIILEFDNS